MTKRGQFTLFVVIGLVAVLLVGLIFFFKNDILSFTGTSEELGYPSEISEVVTHVQECVDASVYEAVANIGYYGGYYILPGSSYVDSENGVSVPYYLYDGNDIMVSKGFIEAQVGVYAKEILTSCLDLDGFDEFNISTGSIDVSAIINNNTVDATVTFPVVVEVEGNSYTLGEDYLTSVNANLGWIYDVARTIVEAHLENPDKFSYSLLESFGMSSIVVTPIENGSLIYVLTDRTSFNEEQPLTFMFAEHYIIEDVECYDDFDCDDGSVCTEGVCKEVKE